MGSLEGFGILRILDNEADEHPFMTDLDLMVERKNESYGDSIGKSADILGIVCPGGIVPSIYHRAHILIRCLDKICRLFSPTIKEHEAIDAWRDLAGYAWKAIQLEEEHNEQNRLPQPEFLRLR